jgi:hypothetical protein
MPKPRKRTVAREMRVLHRKVAFRLLIGAGSSAARPSNSRIPAESFGGDGHRRPARSDLPATSLQLRTYTPVLSALPFEALVNGGRTDKPSSLLMP